MMHCMCAWHPRASTLLPRIRLGGCVLLLGTRNMVFGSNDRNIAASGPPEQTRVHWFHLSTRPALFKHAYCVTQTALPYLYRQP
jgi:hypothetical protein